jgi:hypothetical protein
MSKFTKIVAVLFIIAMVFGCASSKSSTTTATGAEQKPTGGPTGTVHFESYQFMAILDGGWAIFTKFDWNFKKRDITDGSYKNECAIFFQPVIPIPLTESWKLITLPVVPVELYRGRPVDNKKGVIP